MDVVDLRLHGQDGPPVELHPRITLVRGSDADSTRRIVAALEAVCRGQAPEVPVTIAIHGIMCDATDRVLGSLGLDAGANPVITSFGDESAGAEAAPAELGEEGAARLEAARISHDRALDVLTAAEQRRADAEAATAAARAELAASEPGGTPSATEHDVHAARVQVDEAVARRAAAEAELDSEPRPDLDELQAWEERARRHHDELAAQVQQLRAGESTEDRRRTLLSREAELDRDLAELPHGDVTPVREALDAYLEHGDRPAPAEEDSGELEPEQLAAARQEVEAAREELIDAERRARPPEFDPADVAALEQAHGERTEAEERADRPMALPSARRRLKRAKEAEQEILDRMGLPTYGAFLMRTSLVSVDPSMQHAVHQARARLKDAEAHLSEVTDHVARADVGREMAAEAERQEGDAVMEAARARLHAALEHAGAELAGGEDLVESARSWLVRVAEAHDRRRELVAEREQVVADLARLGEGDALTEEVGDVVAELTEQLSRAAGELARAREAMEEAREKVATWQATQGIIDDARHQEDAARSRLVALERSLEEHGGGDLDRLRRRLADAHQELDDAQDALVAARTQLDEAVAERRRAEAHTSTPAARAAAPAGGDQDEAGRIEVFTLARLATQRSVGRAGPLPLVIDGALDQVPVEHRGPTLDLLSRMAPAMQIVVVSDDHHVVAWAEEQGIERALVTAPQEP